MGEGMMDSREDEPVALETRERAEDARQFSPSAERNRDPILDVLRAQLASDTPGTLKVLEIASGTGEHAVHFTRGLGHVLWQPTDPDPHARASIAAWTRREGLDRILPPVALDASADLWPVEEDAPFHAVVSINMVHIAPWAACRGLVAGAARVLAPGGILFLYGPFKRGGVHTTPSNEAFDDSLRGRNAAWGLRDLDEVTALCETAGLGPEAVLPMPANNFSAVFKKA